MEISKLHRKTADCTFASVAQYLFIVAFVQAMRATSLWTTCDATSKVFTERVGSSKVKNTRTAREFEHSWKHFRTGIVVWKDAIDLSSGPGAKVFFHYTEELPFRNITALEKEAAEVWASLRTEGKVQTPGGGVVCTPS